MKKTTHLSIFSIIILILTLNSFIKLTKGQSNLVPCLGEDFPLNKEGTNNLCMDVWAGQLYLAGSSCLLLDTDRSLMIDTTTFNGTQEVDGKYRAFSITTVRFWIGTTSQLPPSDPNNYPYSTGIISERGTYLWDTGYTFPEVITNNYNIQVRVDLKTYDERGFLMNDTGLLNDCVPCRIYAIVTLSFCVPSPSTSESSSVTSSISKSTSFSPSSTRTRSTTPTPEPSNTPSISISSTSSISESSTSSISVSSTSSSTPSPSFSSTSSISISSTSTISISSTSSISFTPTLTPSPTISACPIGHCDDYCGVGVYCVDTDQSCHAVRDLNCEESHIGICADFECAADRCVVTKYTEEYRRHHFFTISYPKFTKTEYKLFNATVAGNFSSINQFGTGIFNENEGEWRGISWNYFSMKLFGITSMGNLYSINITNGDLYLLAHLNVDGDIQDLTFDFSGVSYIATNDNGINKLFSFEVNFLNSTYGNYDPNWVVYLNYITSSIRSIAFDTNDFTMFLIDNENKLYIMRPAAYAEGYCDNQSTNTTLIQVGGISISVSGEIFSGWKLNNINNNLNNNNYSIGIKTNEINNCDNENIIIILEEEDNEKEYKVEYTMVEYCANIVPIVEVHVSNGVPPVVSGSSASEVIASWGSTGVMTIIGVGSVAVCVVFAIIVSLGAASDDKKVTLGTLLEGEGEQVAAVDNAIYLSALNVQENSIFN